MSKLIKSTAIVSAFTMLSRILGLIRDMVLMGVFGTGGAMDAFLVAFKLPNFLRRLFAEGAFAQAFVPVLSEYQHTQSLAAIQVLVSRVAGALLLLMSGFTALIIVVAPYVMGVFAVGYLNDPDKFAMATALLRVTFPYVLFISITAFASSLLQSVHRFALPAFAPVLLNVCMIVAALWVAPQVATPIMAVGYAVAVAGLLQLLIHLPALAEERLLVAPKVDFQHPGVHRILMLILPALFGVSITQINLLINSVFASFMVDGSVAWLYTAERLSELPLGLIGVAIGTVILPSLSSSATRGSHQEFGATLDWALTLVWLIGLPASLSIALLADVIMVALFEHGEFGHHDALMSALALQGLAGGVLGFMLIKVLAPAFFARHDSRTPVKIGVWSVAANVALSMGLMPLFGLLQLPQHGALALANTLAAFINAGLLYYGLHRKGVFRLGGHWRGLMVKLLLANGVLVTVLYLGIQHFPMSAPFGWRITVLLLLCVVGLLVYALTLLGLGFKVSDLKPKHS